jgi:hypothetical protein
MVIWSDAGGSMWIGSRSVPYEFGAGNALMGAYYAELGLSDKAIVFFTIAHPNNMGWLSAKIVDEIGLTVINLSEYVQKEKQTAKARADNDPDGMKLWCRQLLRQGNTSPHCTEPVEQKPSPAADYSRGPIATGPRRCRSHRGHRSR